MSNPIVARLPFIVLILLFSALLAYLNWPEAKAEGKGKSKSRAVKVAVTSVNNVEFRDLIEALGTAKANEAVTIYSEFDARIKSIHFSDGDKVKQGQLLLRLHSEEEQAEVKELEAKLSEAKTQFKRLADLQKTKSTSQSMVDEQAAQVAAVKAQLERAKAKLAKFDITAPFDGILGLRQISVGALLSGNDAITTLDDTGLIKVDFTVPEKDLTKVKIGQKIEATNIAYQDTFVGKVVSIDPRLDAITRAVSVRAVIDNPELKLNPGMLLSILLERSVDNTIILPETVLIPRANKQFVFVVDGQGVAKEQEVEIGRRRPGLVEVLSGLEVGQQVVTEGTMKVRDGATVELVN